MEMIEHELPPAGVYALAQSAIRIDGARAYVREMKYSGSIPVPSAGTQTILVYGYLSSFTCMELAALVTKADDDDAITRTVLIFDTGGGAVAGIEEAAAAIRSAKKPVIGYVLGSALSGGMWLLSACHERHATATAELGSIGVWTALYLPAVDGRDSEYGFFVLKSSRAENKVFPADRKAVLEAQQVQIDLIEGRFLNAVATAAGKSTEQVVADFNSGDTRLAMQVEGYARVTPMASVLRPEPEPETVLEPEPVPVEGDTPPEAAGGSAPSKASAEFLASMAAAAQPEVPPGAGASVVEVAQESLAKRIAATKRQRRTS